jgi:hypothetical protein
MARESRTTGEVSTLPWLPVDINYPRGAARDVNAAIEELHDWFPDHEPALLSQTSAAWCFRLSWASDAATFVDPEVAKCAAGLFGLTLQELGGYHKVHKWGGRPVLFSMVHAWALLAPSLAMERRQEIGPVQCIVHVDDHTDLGELPMLPGGTAGTLKDLLSDASLVIPDPRSVVAAIHRGVVSKGNFLTAFLLAYPEARLFHVKRDVKESSFHLVQNYRCRRLGGRGLPRTKLCPRTAKSGNGRFVQRATLPTAIEPAGQGVWLDIDLDFFWNRYNGDSDRLLALPMPGECDRVMLGVDDFLTNLSRVSWLTDIATVSISVSPGFFPTDYWKAVIPAVRNGVQSLLEAHPLAAK